jgi:hypothetical protein
MSDTRDEFDPFGDDDKPEGEKRRFERAVPEVLRRVIERAVVAGIEKISEAPDNIRDLVGDMKLPKEAANYLYEQIDDTKKGVYRVVAKEIRDVLEHLDLADEIANVLTKLSFEINTTIRFVPNPAAEAQDKKSMRPPAGGSEPPKEEGAVKRPSRIPRPTVVSKVVMKARDTLDKLGGSEPPPPPPPQSEE